VKPYKTFRRNGQLWARPDYSQYGERKRVKDPKYLLQDGSIVCIGRKCFLVSFGEPEVEWEETYGIREQMIAIWGEEKGKRQLGECDGNN
jgi:hypothetical protein